MFKAPTSTAPAASSRDDQRRIARRRRTLAIDLRAGERRQPGDVEQVLDRERNARERPSRPCERGAVDCSRFGERAFAREHP